MKKRTTSAGMEIHMVTFVTRRVLRFMSGFHLLRLILDAKGTAKQSFNSKNDIGEGNQYMKSWIDEGQ